MVVLAVVLILVGRADAQAQGYDSLVIVTGPFAPLGDSLHQQPASHRTVFKGPHPPVRRWYCPPAVYPPELWHMGVHGRVVFRFVVDTLGRPEVEDMVLVEATHNGFVPAARRAVAKCRFDPARHEGRRVRILVHQGVRFRPDSTKSNF